MVEAPIKPKLTMAPKHKELSVAQKSPIFGSPVRKVTCNNKRESQAKPTQNLKLGNLGFTHKSEKEGPHLYALTLVCMQVTNNSKRKKYSSNKDWSWKKQVEWVFCYYLSCQYKAQRNSVYGRIHD